MTSRMHKAVIAAFAASLLFAATAPSTAQVTLTRKEQDGILATMMVVDSNVFVFWRFMRPLVKPIEDVSATLGGRPLGVPSVESYPVGDEKTAIVALLDITDKKRIDPIERMKRAMLLLGARHAPHQSIALGVYGLEGKLIVPRADNPQDLVQLLAALQPIDEPANLSGALISAIHTLGPLSVSRRAIYVFTDGHNDGRVTLPQVQELARKVGVSINFLLIRDNRPADPALKQLAEQTGGEVVEENELIAYLRHPFDLIDSGARVSFPIGKAKRYPWEINPEVNVVFHYGGGQLTLNAPVQLPRASMGETADYILDNHATVAAVSGAGVLAFAGIGALALLRRRRGAPAKSKAKAAAPDPKPIQVLAVLQNIDDGSAYSVNSPVANIGRASTNEIVIEDASVSRLHAVLQQEGFGAFTIENRSGNGTFVNHQKIDKSPLVDGDLITVGSTTLRYAQNDKKKQAAKTPKQEQPGN